MSVILGKTAAYLSRLKGHRGTNIGGNIAYKFDKKIFKKLSRNIDHIILVTGTNGKSTITNIIAQTLSDLDYRIISNRLGANMYTGIIASMVEAQDLFKQKHFQFGVFEVDEGSIPKVISELDQCTLVVSNFFRDQLDRYSEMDMLINKIGEAIKHKDVNLIINVDDPFCMRLINEKYIGYGLSAQIDLFKQGSVSDSKYCPVCNKLLVYTHHFYGQLGHYECDCGFKRTSPKYLLETIKPNEVVINQEKYQHKLKGDYNAYNILAAISVLLEFNIDQRSIKKSLQNYTSNDGRMQRFMFKDKITYLNLVKNPAGMNMTLQEAQKLNIKQMCFVLNDFEGDGTDVSWIWDCDLEYLLELDITRYLVCGTRAEEMALRIKNMGVASNMIIINELFESFIEIIPTENTLISASYTALNATKEALLKKEAL